MVPATSTRLMTARMTTVITMRCYIFSADRITQVGPVWCHPGNTWVAPGSRLHSVQTESDPVSAGLRRFFARVTPGSRQRLHPCCTRVAPCLCPVTPRSPPSHARATPGDALVTSRSHPGYTQPMLGPCPRHCMSWTSCPRATLALQPRPPKLHQGYSKVVPSHTQATPRLHPGCTGATPRLRTRYAPVVPR